MSTHQATVPTKAAAYFGPTGYADHPTVEQVFRPGVGWRRTNYRKRVSGSWLRKLRAEGVTSVALRCHGRLADFQVKELLS